MAEKAKKSKKDNKNLIIGCCTAFVLVVAIIITAVVLNNNTLNDGYFVSDNTKYVLTIEADEVDSNNEEITPVKTHQVFTYDGDKITSMKTYYVFADGNAAKTAFDTLKKELEGQEQEQEQIANIEVNDKYVIVTAKEESYKDLTASDVKQQIEFLEKLKNMNTDSDTNTSEEDTTSESTDADAENENQ